MHQGIVAFTSCDGLGEFVGRAGVEGTADTAKTKWVASIQPSAGAIVEYYRPCSVEQGIAPTSLRDLPHSTLRKMKRELEHYSIRNASWKTG